MPRHEQIELIAHRREVNLRKAHREKVGEIVAKLDDPNDTDAKKKPGRR